jgi:hypothetical protein
MHIRRITFVLILALFTAAHCYSQESKVGNWFNYFGNQQINKKWNWWNEIQYRNYNFAGDLQQLLIRTGIGYNLTENNNNILLGYGFIHGETYPAGSQNKDDKVGTNEHRIYQQFITRQNFGRVFVQHRYRIEERFRETDFIMRYRYFLSLNVPINSKTMSPKAWYASAYNEIFLNGTSPVFDRNRVYGAIGYVIDRNLKVELGFMTQIQENGSRPQFQMVFFNNLPLKKMQD